MELDYPLRILFQGSGLSTIKYPSHSNSRNWQPIRACPRHHGPLSCVHRTTDWKTNTCRLQNPLRFNRNGPRMFKCRNAADTSPKLLTDGKIEEGDVSAEEDDDDDYPDWIEEDDPTWPADDPNGDGVGFQISDFFEPKVENMPNEDGSVDSEQLDLNWEAEQYQWNVREITSAEWELVAKEDPTPLIFLAFERYGPSGPECWKLLEELEKVLRIIVDSRRYPIRAAKLDISSEPAVGAALKLRSLPELLFINGGKLVYRLSGVKTADELLAITSHLFYHSARPACMDEVETSHTVIDISSSGSS